LGGDFNDSIIIIISVNIGDATATVDELLDHDNPTLPTTTTKNVTVAILLVGPIPVDGNEETDPSSTEE
jgi:hypothetical protein